MAEETVDTCIKTCKLKAGKSMTKGLLLEGAHDWTPTMFIRLIQDFGLDVKVENFSFYRATHTHSADFIYLSVFHMVRC